MKPNASTEENTQREERTELKTYRVRVYHVGCGGEYKSTGQGFTTMDTSWLNRCDKCRHEVWSDRTYPYTEHKPA